MKDSFLCSIIIPVYNEERNIDPLLERLVNVLKAIDGCSYEIIFAMVKSVLACRHAGFGCVKAASCLAQSPTVSIEWLTPKMPKGLIRIMAPLAWGARTLPQAGSDNYADNSFLRGYPSAH